MKILFGWLFPSYLQMNVAAIGAAAAVGGAAISANASSKASGAQAGSAAAANGMSDAQFQRTRADNAPFMQSGVAANNLLSGYLGISGDAPTYTRDQLYSQAQANGVGDVYGKSGKKYFEKWRVDAEVERQLAAQEARQQQVQAMQASGQYGSLLKPFSQADLDADPIYQNTFKYALDTGMTGVNQQASATGSLLGGNTLKALSRLGANTAATFGNDSFNRDNASKTRTYNSLAGISGSGQQAVNQVSSAGAANAQTQGNNLIGAGNARGASSIAGANAINGAIGTGINAYQSQSLIDSLNNRRPYGVAQQPGVTGWNSGYDL